MGDGIHITWPGGEATFERGATVHLGRDAGSEVVLENANVSRRHAELTHDGSGWVLHDVGSAQGTFSEGSRVESLPIRGSVTVTLGREGKGDVLQLTTDEPARTEPPPLAPPVGPTEMVGATPGPGDLAGAGTVIVGGEPAASGGDRPGGRLRADAVEGATVVTGNTINLECGGRSYTFQPGADVTIGRDGDCDVVSSNPTVSRRHARLGHDGEHWTLEDLGSSGGTYVDGARIDRLPIAGTVAVWLGDEDTGERMVLVTSGTHKVPMSSRVAKASRRGVLLPVVGVILVLCLLVGAGFLLFGGGPSDDDLARATVRVVSDAGAGSGTVIDAEQGLILTNAHVAAPSAVGNAVRKYVFEDELTPDPKELEIQVAPGLEKDAEPRFVAEVVAVDGYLDLAVLKITETAGGRIVEPDSGDLDDLVQVDVGNSDDLGTGDDIRVFGYPGASQTTTVTLTEGVVSGPVKDERLRSNRGMLNISADIRPGNSGGLAANGDGEIVGVPSIIREDEVPSMRPINYAVPLIEAAKEGKKYTSTFVRARGDESVSNIGVTAPGTSDGIAFTCDNGELTSTADGVGVTFDYEGFDAGKPQDLMVVVTAGDETIGVWALNDEYPVEWPASSGCATVTVPVDTSGLEGQASLGVRIGVGPTYGTP
jgi:pSer/pThr/pTyr-binding forkhead associated (FHA) protein/S1-C subfamily serine protease